MSGYIPLWLWALMHWVGVLFFFLIFIILGWAWILKYKSILHLMSGQNFMESLEGLLQFNRWDISKPRF